MLGKLNHQLLAESWLVRGMIALICLYVLMVSYIEIEAWGSTPFMAGPDPVAVENSRELSPFITAPVYLVTIPVVIVWFIFGGSLHHLIAVWCVILFFIFNALVRWLDY